MDTARFFLLSLAAPEKDRDWSEEGIQGSLRLIKSIFNKFENIKISKKSDPKIESKLNKIIKEVTNDIENFKYNLAIIKIRELFNSLPEETSKEVLEKSLKLLSPFCPHIAEELWEKIGNKGFISTEKWPEYDEKKIDSKFEKQEESMDRIVADILNIQKIVESRGEVRNKIYVYVIPNEKENYDSLEISKRVGKGVSVFAVNDSKKYDPNNISKKSKPGKPGIYME
jgi:leucyl-tRNA synthetase